MAHQIGARSMGIVPLVQSWINLCCAQSLILPHDGSYDFSQFSDALPLRDEERLDFPDISKIKTLINSVKPIYVEHGEVVFTGMVTP